MSMISRDDRKKQKGIKKFINSFDYSTSIAPDLNKSNIEYRYYSHNLNGNIVELAKKYSTDNSPKFVNGVLSYIYNNYYIFLCHNRY